MVQSKKIGLKTLKDLGFGKQSLEELMNIEFEEMLNNFLSTNQDFLLSTDFNVPIINILWQLVARGRFTKDDPVGQEVIAFINKMFKCYMKMIMIPLRILKMFPKLTEYEENVKIYKVQRDYVLKQIEQHENSFDEENPRDYIDVYLTEMNKNEADSNFTKIDLAVSMLDFLHAGTETSSTTLKWILLYLTLYQYVQDK